MTFSYKKIVTSTFEDTITKTKEELSKEGFGVLTEIDVKATLKKKLHKDFSKYVIIGACNPLFAYRSLQAEREIGLFLPCNIIVYEQEHKIFVSTILPSIAMSMIANKELEQVAKEVETKLKKVIDSI